MSVEYSGQLVENGGFYRNGRCSKQASPPRCGGGLRNSNPIGRASLRNTSPLRQKVFKTKPRDLDEETLATFGKVVDFDGVGPVDFGLAG
ncbi:hypothetical protein AHAS_Ahas17G0153700 [Arachis hypogaea]